MPTLGIIGSGHIGTAIARLAVAAGIPVVMANSRGPHSLARLTGELGPLADAGTAEEAARAGDLTLTCVPLTAVPTLPADALRGRTVLDTTNYHPHRDGRITPLDREELTTGELVRQHLPGARLVKAFNTILAHHIPQLARPTGAPDRSALPLAGDDADAKASAARLIDRLGFDTVDAGPLAASWRFEPGSTACIRLYAADPDVPHTRLPDVPALPVPAEGLRAALTHSRRVRVADRMF
ncbi:NADP oxidoreductase [Streptomyces sp. CB02923]|uniref:NADPH-dependent F420 reductase n=1 Tax=Streptomyces sp. CB02923 TaxID=1718985 RepID=UPI00093E870F|nr:NAD(P)-binding domain-containing protein [Streptomyces sp. CB02923]OKI10122.1 NADP oxidoreductase [Streptomyces sp. CB02923]